MPFAEFLYGNLKATTLLKMSELNYILQGSLDTNNSYMPPDIILGLQVDRKMYWKDQLSRKTNLISF